MNSVFKNQIVWVTGASSGIGEAMARDFVKRGAKVILTARREDRLQKLADELNQGSSTPCAKILPADLSKLNELSALTDKALALFGRIDVLLNNAGVSQRSLALETPFEVEEHMIKLDLISPIALTKALLPHFVKQKSGRFIVTSSLMGDLELPGSATYACVKHGLNGYFYSLAFELKEHNIDVQVLQPGFVRTEVSLKAVTSDGTSHGKMDSTHDKAMSPEKFSEKTFKKLERGDTSIIVAGKEGLALPVRRWFPGLYRTIVAKTAKSMFKERFVDSKT